MDISLIGAGEPGGVWTCPGGFGSDWTTYELRHSFVFLVADPLDDLVKVADLAGPVRSRQAAAA